MIATRAAPEVAKRRTTLVIGYGNSLCGDDGFGWRVAMALQANADPTLEVVPCQQLTLELAYRLADVGRVVFVDASVTVPAGVLSVRDLEPSTASEPLTHHLEPPQLLALTRAVFGRAPRATLVSVGAVNLEPHEGLTPPVAAMIPCALEEIDRVRSVAVTAQ
jgi:hydrogenase maturation protease